MTTIKLKAFYVWYAHVTKITQRMVRVAGFEPTASWPRTKRDTKLRHTRIDYNIIRKGHWNVKDFSAVYSLPPGHRDRTRKPERGG